MVTAAATERTTARSRSRRCASYTWPSSSSVPERLPGRRAGLAAPVGHRAGQGELPLGAHQVVVAAAGEPLRVPAEVAIVEHVDAEARGQLDADRLDAAHDGLDLARLEQAGGAGRVPAQGGGVAVEV